MNSNDKQSIAADFQRDSYVLAQSVFNTEQLTELEADFDQIAGRLKQDTIRNNARWHGSQTDELDGGNSVILHTHNIQSYSAAWMRALLAPKFLDYAEAILGPDVMLHHSKLFYKPPRVGAPFPMHQDWEHFPTEKDSMMAAVIHLHDTNEEMGCLRLYPGSHKRGRLEGMKGEGKGSQPREEFSVKEATPISAKAGDVLFFHYLTVHGSTQNLSVDPRKTVLVQLHAGNDRVTGDNKHTNVKLTLRGFNHHATRQNVGGIR